MTSFDTVIDRFLHRVERDSDFFSYYNLSRVEAENLVQEQALAYLIDAIDMLTSKCSPSVDFYDYDYENETFNFDLTGIEINLLAMIMFLVYLERQESLLGAFKIRMAPSDVNLVTPSTERSTFLALVKDTRKEVDIAISRYASTDRETQAPLMIDHSVYDYDE